MKNWKKALTIALPMTLALSFSSFAGQWHEDMNGWWYENDDGSYLKNGWHWVDGNEDGRAECYYFNLKGYVVNSTRQVDGYTVDEDGAWTVNGEVQTKKVSLPNDSAAMDVYLEAAEKNKDLDSLDASVKAAMTMEMDGESTDMGMDVSMKMRGAKSGKLEFVMDGSMDVLGMEMPFTSFYTDGYMYTDTMGMKTKQETSVYDAIESANSTMEMTDLELSMITNMKMHQDGEDTVLTYSLNRTEINDYLDEFMGVGGLADLSEFGFQIGYDIRRADGEVVIDKNGYYTRESMYMDMSMTMTELESGETESINYKMALELNINNPGEPVEFTLPSTEGFMDVSQALVYDLSEDAAEV